jgi:hypothetical protein
MCTQEAEYHALSQLMHALLPLCELIIEIMDALQLSKEVSMSFRCAAHLKTTMAPFSLQQINASPIALSTTVSNGTGSGLMSTTKKRTLALRRLIRCSRGLTSYLTKGLTRENFERIRKLVQG